MIRHGIQKKLHVLSETKKSKTIHIKLDKDVKELNTFIKDWNSNNKEKQIKSCHFDYSKNVKQNTQNIFYLCEIEEKQS